MPCVNFSAVDSGTKYPPLPAARYLCEIERVEERRTRNGADMLALVLSVAEGKYKERLFFDHLVFHGAGLDRIKNLCEALGFDVSGEIDLTPDSLLGRRVTVEVIVAEYRTKQGMLRCGNEVTFSGYSPADSEGKTISKETHGGEDDIPF